MVTVIGVVSPLQITTSPLIVAASAAGSVIVTISVSVQKPSKFPLSALAVIK
jgi:hypothetical protein